MSSRVGLPLRALGCRRDHTGGYGPNTSQSHHARASSPPNSARVPPARLVRPTAKSKLPGQGQDRGLRSRPDASVSGGEERASDQAGSHFPQDRGRRRGHAEAHGRPAETKPGALGPRRAGPARPSRARPGPRRHVGSAAATRTRPEPRRTGRTAPRETRRRKALGRPSSGERRARAGSAAPARARRAEGAGPEGAGSAGAGSARPRGGEPGNSLLRRNASRAGWPPSLPSARRPRPGGGGRSGPRGRRLSRRRLPSPGAAAPATPASAAGAQVRTRPRPRPGSTRAGTPSRTRPAQR